MHATLSSDPLASIVTPLIDIITAIDLHLFRSLLLSPSLFLWIVCSGAPFITWIGNWTIKTHTIFSIVKSGNQTRHTYIFNIKGSRCYYYHHHHQHHCYNHQLTAVSFVGTVATVGVAVTHYKRVDTFPVWALPVGSGALPFDWRTKWSPSVLRVNTFVVTVFVSLHFHTLLFSLHSSFSSLSCIHHFHRVHSPWESVLFTYIVSCIQRYCHIRSPPSVLYTSTLSLPLIISTVHLYCHLHSHWTCPCGACTGMVKASTGTGLLILCLHRPCMGMVRVSLPSRVCFGFLGIIFRLSFFFHVVPVFIFCFALNVSE